MDLTDEQIVERVQKGNVDEFEHLVLRYRQKMLNYGSRLLFRRGDLEDIVQEIFIKTFRNLQSFDRQRKFSTWIYRIAHNEFINYGKKFSRQLIEYFDFEILLPQTLRAPADKSPENEYDRQQVQLLVESKLKDLEAKYREPLVLYYLEGFDYKEISEVLRLPISTVGVRLSRAKGILKKILMQNHGPK